MALLNILPPPPQGKSGWPWTEETDATLYSPDISYPKVSIVMPTYNQGAYIEEAIRSLLLQNYPNLEFIIMDGGSTDQTLEIIKKYEPWITNWTSGKDKGQSHAINMGLAKSTGDWFNWLNSDDYLLKDAFYHLSKAIVEEKEKPVAVCGEPLAQDLDQIIRELPVRNTNTFYDDFIAIGYYQVTALYDIDIVRQFNGVDESLHFGMDLKLVMQVNLAGPIVRTDKHIIVIRSQPQSKGVSQSSKFYSDWIKAYASLISYLPENVINEKLMDILEKLTGISFKERVPCPFPIRFSEEEYKYGQLYMAERIVNLMYIFKQPGLVQLIKFIKENHPEYYKQSRLWALRVKVNPVVRLVIQGKKVLTGLLKSRR